MHEHISVESTMESLLGSSRLMRNLAEKMRRDKLNMYITELSTLVPIVAMATKRMDKTSILRLSANFLRVHLSLKGNTENLNWKPDNVDIHNIGHLLLECLDGLLLVLTSSGKIVFVSDNVEKVLGHSQLDLMGQSIYSICHQDDQDCIRHHLTHPAWPMSSETAPSSNAGECGDDDISRSPSGVDDRSNSPSSMSNDHVPKLDNPGSNISVDINASSSSANEILHVPSTSIVSTSTPSFDSCFGERRSFYARVSERSLSRGDPNRYEMVHFVGHLRAPPNAKDNSSPTNSRKNKGSPEQSNLSLNDLLFVCVARPVRDRPITELSLIEAVQDEYITRHLPDCRIVYTDQRIATVAGYFSDEVIGISAFDYIFKEDVPWAAVAQKEMFSNVDGQGFVVYRLRGKTGKLIYLRSRGFLEFNKTTQKVETFVCINTMIGEEEGERQIQELRERFTPFVAFQKQAIGGPPDIVEMIASGTMMASDVDPIATRLLPAITPPLSAPNAILSPLNNTSSTSPAQLLPNGLQSEHWCNSSELSMMQQTAYTGNGKRSWTDNDESWNVKRPLLETSFQRKQFVTDSDTCYEELCPSSTSSDLNMNIKKRNRTMIATSSTVMFQQPNNSGTESKLMNTFPSDYSELMLSGLPNDTTNIKKDSSWSLSVTRNRMSSPSMTKWWTNDQMGQDCGSTSTNLATQNDTYPSPPVSG